MARVIVQVQADMSDPAIMRRIEKALDRAALKLERKGCDLIVANDVSRTDLGFDVDRNEVWIVGPARGDVTHVPPAAKHDVAARILDRIREIRPS